MSLNIVWTVAVVLWVAFLIAIYLGRKSSRRPVETHARDVSGIIVGGNVEGDVVQKNQTSPAQAETPAKGRGYLGRAGLIFGILAAIATIAGFVMTLTSGTP